MRIIAGDFKGRRLVSPKGSGTRPTSDRVREAVFSILGDRVAGARVLDLYSGTGAMGLEALSRGARHTVFVESDPAAVHCLSRNIELCRCRDRSKVVTVPAIPYLERGDVIKDVDLVFADPPYRSDLGTLTLLAISKHAKPRIGCLIILEHAPDNLPGHVPEPMRLVDARKYGNVGVTFFELEKIRGA